MCRDGTDAPLGIEVVLVPLPGGNIEDGSDPSPVLCRNTVLIQGKIADDIRTERGKKTE